MANKTLTQKYLREVLRYEPGTGRFFWRKRPRSHFGSEEVYRRWNTRFSGKEMKTKSSLGYIRPSIDNKQYLAHRLAYLWMTGIWPDGEVDHINHNGFDNRWDNLRVVDRTAQMRNTSISKNNTSGVNGVHWDKRSSRWIARITVDRKIRCLGSFKRMSDAIAARTVAEHDAGFHENHGRSV